MSIAEFRTICGGIELGTAGFHLAGDNAGFCTSILNKTTGNAPLRLESLTYILPTTESAEQTGQQSPVIVNLLMQLRAFYDQSNTFLRANTALEVQLTSQLRQVLARSNSTVRAQAREIEQAIRGSLLQDNELRRSLARLEHEVKKNENDPVGSKASVFPYAAATAHLAVRGALPAQLWQVLPKVPAAGRVEAGSVARPAVQTVLEQAGPLPVPLVLQNAPALQPEEETKKTSAKSENRETAPVKEQDTRTQGRGQSRKGRKKKRSSAVEQTDAEQAPQSENRPNDHSESAPGKRTAAALQQASVQNVKTAGESALSVPKRRESLALWRADQSGAEAETVIVQVPGRSMQKKISYRWPQLTALPAMWTHTGLLTVRGGRQILQSAVTRPYGIWLDKLTELPGRPADGHTALLVYQTAGSLAEVDALRETAQALHSPKGPVQYQPRAFADHILKKIWINTAPLPAAKAGRYDISRGQQTLTQANTHKPLTVQAQESKILNLVRWKTSNSRPDTRLLQTGRVSWPVHTVVLERFRPMGSGRLAPLHIGLGRTLSALEGPNDAAVHTLSGVVSTSESSPVQHVLYREPDTAPQSEPFVQRAAYSQAAPETGGQPKRATTVAENRSTPSTSESHIGRTAERAAVAGLLAGKGRTNVLARDIRTNSKVPWTEPIHLTTSPAAARLLQPLQHRLMDIQPFGPSNGQPGVRTLAGGGNVGTDAFAPSDRRLLQPSDVWVSLQPKSEAQIQNGQRRGADAQEVSALPVIHRSQESLPETDAGRTTVQTVGRSFAQRVAFRQTAAVQQAVARSRLAVRASRPATLNTVWRAPDAPARTVYSVPGADLQNMQTAHAQNVGFWPLPVPLTVPSGGQTEFSPVMRGPENTLGLTARVGQGRQSIAAFRGNVLHTARMAQNLLRRSAGPSGERRQDNHTELTHFAQIPETVQPLPAETAAAPPSAETQHRIVYRAPAPQPAAVQAGAEQSGEAVLQQQVSGWEQPQSTLFSPPERRTPAKADNTISELTRDQETRITERVLDEINYNRLTEELLLRVERRLRAERRKFGL